MAKKLFPWICLVIFCTANPVTASSISGMTPVDFCSANETFENCKSEVKLYVGKLASSESDIEYEYKDFDFCKMNESNIPPEDLVQAPFGELIQLSPYKWEFLKNVKCATVCRREYSGSDNETINRLEFLKKGIALDYHYHWTVDDIPVTWCLELFEWSYCVTDIRMGKYYKPDTYRLFNHMDFTITYSRLKEESNSTFKENGGRIISVTVVPRSIAHGSNPDCESDVPLEISDAKLPPDQQLSVTYTYSVKFVEKNTLKWSSRYDYFRQSLMLVKRITGWFLNTFVTQLFLSGIVAVIMRWTLPITRYKQMELEEDPENESGWWVIRNDVFRPPRNGLLLSALLGSGVIIFLMIFVILVFVYLGFRSTSHMTELVRCVVISYACLSSVGGYVSAVIYKSFSGKKYKWNMLLTSLLTPSPLYVFSIVFSLLCLINITVWMTGRYDALSISIFIWFLEIWFGVSVPMTLAGAYFGFKQKPLEYPVAANEVDPRPIPKRKFFTQAVAYILMGGVSPFGFTFLQSVLALWDLWRDEVYYITRCFLTFFIFVIPYSEITILLCYIHLSAENYHWWWRSFLTFCSTAFYMLMYCIYFAIMTWGVTDATSMLVYILFSCIMMLPFFLLMGSIGFFVCFWFVRRIYSVEKDFKSAQSIKLRWFRFKTDA